MSGAVLRWLAAASPVGMFKELKRLNVATAAVAVATNLLAASNNVKLILVVGLLQVVQVNMDRNAVLSSVYEAIKGGDTKSHKNLAAKEQIRDVDLWHRRYSMEPTYEIIKGPPDEYYLAGKYEIDM